MAAGAFLGAYAGFFHKGGVACINVGGDRGGKDDGGVIKGRLSSSWYAKAGSILQIACSSCQTTFLSCSVKYQGYCPQQESTTDTR